jgi:CheY-like chemotaxis protein
VCHDQYKKSTPGTKGMDIQELNVYYNKLKYGEEIFHTLMQKRVREILLVSTFYDAYVFEQDGRLSERIFGEFHQLNLTYPPRIISVPTGEEALRKIEEGEIDFDLVVTMMRTGEMTPFELSRKIKQKRPNLPVLLLLTSQSDIPLIEKAAKERHDVDSVFLWNGDPQVFLAMIKYIEDLMNVEHDTAKGLVRVVLLVEDSIYFYSRFLPILYKEIMLQTQRLISEELTDMQKNYRRHTRPKVLMAHTLEDAIQICEKYKEYLLSVISDIRFLNQGRLDPEAGIQLIHYLKSLRYDIPILLQSSETTLKQKARELNVSFLDKHSKSLLNDLSEFIYSNLGFGDFIFRDHVGNEIARASTISEFEQRLQAIPDETLSYHSRKTFFRLADRARRN